MHKDMYVHRHKDMYICSYVKRFVPRGKNDFDFTAQRIVDSSPPFLFLLEHFFI
jgi:hypothetical protein